MVLSQKKIILEVNYANLDSCTRMVVRYVPTSDLSQIGAKLGWNLYKTIFSYLSGMDMEDLSAV